MTPRPRLSLALLAALLSLAVVGPLLAPDPNAQPALANGSLAAPSAAHWLGTDQFSRDVFARLAHGARASLTVASIAVSVSALLGMLIGVAAGVSGPLVGGMLRRLIDIGLALPRVVVLLVLLAAVGTLPLPLFALVLGLTGWPSLARLVRGETLRLRQTPFVDAARALGAPPARIALHEILPGALPPLLVAATLGTADAILLEAGLSFLGLGIRPPEASWGGMLLEARDHLGAAPWLLLAPGIALVLATATATLLGDALRRSLNPDHR
ncbi:MAG: ABC transporter permease [Gemmatimonadetes bacterium]|nr:ABC transporter permease [Gemmatimonadota bacterium]